MSKFDLPNAVTLFTQNVTSINSLWTVYVFATFALAGYGLSAPTIEIEIAIVVTAGFWAFAFGHWKLLKQALVINRSLSVEISQALTTSEEGDNQFRGSFRHLSAMANPPLVSLAIHLLIDLCCTLALWTRLPPVALWLKRMMS
jgi:hypothetical protein